jgi:hypothetical protein
MKNIFKSKVIKRENSYFVIDENKLEYTIGEKSVGSIEICYVTNKTTEFYFISNRNKIAELICIEKFDRTEVGTLLFLLAERLDGLSTETSREKYFRFLNDLDFIIYNQRKMKKGFKL